MTSGRFLFEQLEKGHDRRSFSCGEEALDRYLAKTARQDVKRRVTVAFVLVDTVRKRKIAGFYSLSAASVSLKDIPESVQRKLPRYPDVPVVLLGRLAVDQEYQGQGFGALLLVDAIRRALEGSRLLGAAAVVVDAKHEAARAFYEHYGFIRFADDANALRLFLPMTSIEQLLSEQGS